MTTTLPPFPAPHQPVITPVDRMRRDIAMAAIKLSDDEARFLVDAYYMMQEDRKRAHNQVRALGEHQEPNSVLVWLADQSSTLEKQIARALDKYTEAHLMGAWMRQIKGIGPIIAAGLLAHLSIRPWRCRAEGMTKCIPDYPCTDTCAHERIETVGHWWRYAGLDPTVKWEKGQKRPWNARLKVLCWKAGQSFMKLSNDEDCYYGRLYRERKAFEIQRNERGDNRDIALVNAQRVGRGTEAFKHLSEGKLPPGQIDARARRWAVKAFLADMHAQWYRLEFGEAPPLPYAISILGHAHLRRAPLPVTA